MNYFYVLILLILGVEDLLYQKVHSLLLYVLIVIGMFQNPSAWFSIVIFYVVILLYRRFFTQYIGEGDLFLFYGVLLHDGFFMILYANLIGSMICLIWLWYFQWRKVSYIPFFLFGMFVYCIYQHIMYSLW